MIATIFWLGGELEVVSCWQEEAPLQRMEIYESRKDFLTCKSDEEFFGHGKMHDNIE